jgi:benzoylformate decarboxylase
MTASWDRFPRRHQNNAKLRDIKTFCSHAPAWEHNFIATNGRGFMTNLVPVLSCGNTWTYPLFPKPTGCNPWAFFIIMLPMTGIDIILEMLSGCGIRYMFGNPGTTELPLIDAMVAEQRIKYILALQEVPVVAIADGYAQASRMPGVVNLHACCGLGNGMGMIYNAFREGTPLVITAGQQDQRMALEEPILWGRMVDVVRPWTKWAEEIRRVQDLPSAIRRAVQTAMTPPTGPVFLALPLDVQMGTFKGSDKGTGTELRSEPVPLDTTPPRLPDFNVRPPTDALKQAAAVLASARNPGILVGSRICEADAVAELVTVAERLGAPVMHEATTSHGRCSFPSDHPLASAQLPFWSPQVSQRLAEFDVLLVAGMKLMQQYIYHQPCPIPENVRLVHVDENPWELNKNYPLEVGVIGHPKAALVELASLLDETMTQEQRWAARERLAVHGQKRRQECESLRQEAESQKDCRPMAPLFFMETIAKILPPDVAVIEEAPTTTMGGYLERTAALRNTSGYFAQRGWALGWGLNCAIGVKLAWPDRPVLALIGDGSAMYGIQGLWTAAHYRIPVTFVICNNTEYKILKDCAKVLKLPAACAERFEGLDVVDPVIDYVTLAQSLGVAAKRIAEPDQLSDALQESFKSEEPRLIEVPVRHPEMK